MFGTRSQKNAATAPNANKRMRISDFVRKEESSAHTETVELIEPPVAHENADLDVLEPPVLTSAILENNFDRHNAVEDEVSELRDALHAKDSEIASLQNSFAELERTYDAMQEELIAKGEEVSNLRGALAAYDNIDADDQSLELQKQLAETTQELENLSAAYSQLANTIEEKDALLKSTEEALLAKENEFAWLQNEMSTKESVDVELQQQLMERTQELDVLSSAFSKNAIELEEKDSRLIAAEEALLVRDNTVAELNARVAELQSVAEAKDELAAKISEELTLRLDEVSTLKGQLTVRENDNATLLDEISLKSKDLKELMAAHSELSTELENNVQHLKNAATEAAAKDDVIKQLEADLEAKHQDNVSLQETIASKVEELAALAAERSQISDTLEQRDALLKKSAEALRELLNVDLSEELKLPAAK